MKRFLAIMFVVCIMVTFNNSFAQETEKMAKPGWVVITQNMVPMSEMGAVNKIVDSLFVPVLDGFVKEGKLLRWGQLSHAWGDEWNFNVYYVTESHSAFITFWDEYVKRISDKHPGVWQEIVSRITAHKDNMYSVRHMR